jgi:1-acyl-sn-glycerol-3-phosphate acyltransferase
MQEKNKINRLYWFLHFLIGIYLRTLCRLKLEGVENVPREGGVIIASNHSAAADPFLLGSTIPRELWFMAKRELFESFFQKMIISRVNAFPVDRFSFDLEVIKKSISLLNEGKALIMFPQGTRSRDGEIKDGKIGVGMLARKAGLPIVPVYIENSRKAWWNFLSGKRMKVLFGKAIGADWIKSQANSKMGYKIITEELMRHIRLLREKAGL